MCLAIPEIPPNITYSKGLLECWGNIGVGIVNSMQKAEDPKTQTETHNNIPYQYVALLVHMAGIIVHITNSVSWTEGQLFDFDRFEISRKIKNLHI